MIEMRNNFPYVRYLGGGVSTPGTWQAYFVLGFHDVFSAERKTWKSLILYWGRC